MSTHFLITWFSDVAVNKKWVDISNDFILVDIYLPYQLRNCQQCTAPSCLETCIWLNIGFNVYFLLFQVSWPMNHIYKDTPHITWNFITSYTAYLLFLFASRAFVCTSWCSCHCIFVVVKSIVNKSCTELSLLNEIIVWILP